MSDDDARLREAFAALRREDARRTPLLAPLLVAERGASAARPRLPWLLAATVAGVALLWLARAPEPVAPAPEDYAVGSWSMPSDVLLELPGAELLGAPRWEPLAAPSEPIEPQTRIVPERSHG